MKVSALLLALAAAILLAPAAIPGFPGSIEGRWTLVGQTYGEGGRNLAEAARPVHLEITPGEGTPQVRIYAGDHAADALSWPAWVVDSGPLPVTILERTVSFAEGSLHARYRFRSPGEDRFEVEVEETYKSRGAVSPGILAGEMVVRFFRDGEPRGSYTLHRRFEKVGP